MNFTASRSISARLHHVIPGGCHTYAKGDDQFPQLAPGAIARGQGSHVWDVDGNEFIEYGSGLRAITLGHSYPDVVEAAQEALMLGCNFSRPASIELDCAEQLLSMLVYGDMVKFAKDGSTVTTAAYKLSRALTGRHKIALCGDHPFFAVHDWFIGTTEISAGISDEIRNTSLLFRYNDPESLAHLFEQHPDQIACVILEPAKYDDPEDDFLHRVRDLCDEHGALMILDEMITGFRWDNAGAQRVYGVEPDFACFGKGMANGFALSALVGKRQYMEIAGLYHDRERVFTLSTTHGAETHAMAAAIATMQVYEREPVIETFEQQGHKLATAVRTEIAKHGLDDYVSVIGKPSNLVFGTRDAEGRPSQSFRALLMQELIARGVLGPSLVINYSHSDADIAATATAFDGALSVYSDALQHGLEGRLVGPPTQTVYRRFNDTPYCTWPTEKLGENPALVISSSVR